jgi:hypothetical protein
MQTRFDYLPGVVIARTVATPLIGHAGHERAPHRS